MDDTLAGQIYKTKTQCDYNGDTKNNFALDGELIVTITLNEYRSLIESKATKQHDIEVARTGKYEAERKLKEVEADYAELLKEYQFCQEKLRKYATPINKGECEA